MNDRQTIPDMEEVAEPDTRLTFAEKGSHLFLFTFMILLAAGFTWAATGKLDVVSRAVGEVVPFSKAKNTLDILNERIHKDEDSLDRTVLKSPVDGTVKTLFVTTIGGIISPGGTVADIVPAEDRLIIEARLPIGDIGYVHTGQAVMVRLAAPNASRLGRLKGEVVHITAMS